ncbi:MAG: sulfotransferase family protein [Promethearchaeota archaeon]
MATIIKSSPDFIGIGVIKAATTWIYVCLREHPEICVSTPKELHFFDELFNYKKGIRYYLSFFRHCPKDKIIGEFTPSYISTTQAPSRIYRHFPNVKLLVFLRNPIERAYSEYKYNIEQKQALSIYKTFEDILKKDRAFLERGFYYRQLKKFFDYFPKENILTLFYKDLKKDPVKFLQKIYKFLDLKNTNFIPPLVNKRTNVTGTRVIQYKIPLITPLIYKIQSYITRSRLLKKLVDKSGIKQLFAKIVTFNTKKVLKQNVEILSIPSIKPQTRTFLYNIYKEDIRKLEKVSLKLLNKDLSFWR